jgi:hypothetical protein
LKKKEVEKLKGFRVDIKACTIMGQETGDIKPGTYDSAMQNKRFGDLEKKMQSMVNSLAEIDLVTNIDNTLEKIDDGFTDYARVFDIPGNMGHFFKQFGSPAEVALDTNSPEYKTLREEENKITRWLMDDT